MLLLLPEPRLCLVALGGWQGQGAGRALQAAPADPLRDWKLLVAMCWDKLAPTTGIPGAAGAWDPPLQACALLS